jgi:tetratricopeptide (TPR) repeat protein
MPAAGGGGGAERTGRGADRRGLILVALVAAAVAVPTLHGGFVYDDVPNVLQNEWIRDGGHLREIFTQQVAAFDPQNRTSFYRPAMHLIYMATWAVAGPRPWAYHLVNLAFHLGCSLLVFLAARRLFARWSDPAAEEAQRFAALTAALVFATHPVRAEAVAWIAGITDLSASFFLLLALVLYLDPRGTRALPLALAAVSFLAATLCKETAFVLPLLLVVIELLPPPGAGASRVRGALLRLAPFALASVVSFGLRWNALGSLAPASRAGTAADPAGWLFDAAWLLARYLGLLLAPFGLGVVHPLEPVRGPSDPRALAGVAALAAVVVTAWLLRRRRVVPVALAWTVVPLLPALYIPALGESVLAERYLYLSVFGFGLAAGHALLLVPSPAVRRGVLAVLTLGLAAGLLAQQAVWRDNLTLWTDAVRRAPSHAPAWEALCFAELEARQFERAVASCERALALDPARDDARINGASAQLALGRFEQALAAYEQALAHRPGSPEALTGRGYALSALGRAGPAMASFQAAIAADPGYAEAHNGLGVALARSGRLAAAVESLRRAVAAAPDRPDYAANLAGAERALTAR